MKQLLQFGKTKALRKDGIRIGFWGTQGSGKTTYLTMLHHCLEKDPRWITNIVQPDFSTAIEHNINRLLDEGEFPAPNPTNITKLEISSYMMIARKKRGLPMSITLNFIDAPGEFYEELAETDVTVIEKTLSDQNEKQEERIGDIVDFLITCQGIIIFLDPKQVSLGSKQVKDKVSYRKLLMRFFQECRSRYSNQKNSDLKLLPQYFAFCVTKIDAEIDGIDIWKEAQKPMDLAKKIMGDNLFERLNNFFYFDLDNPNSPQKHRCKFYGVSSIGRYCKDGDYKTAVESQANNSESSPSQRKMDFQESAHNDISESSPIDQKMNHQEQILDKDEGWATLRPNTKTETVFETGDRIKVGINQEPINLEPINVVAPVEWLIRSILCYPPRV